MAFLPIILLLILLAVAVYFLRATTMAVDRGEHVGGMGERGVKTQAEQDKKKVNEAREKKDT